MFERKPARARRVAPRPLARIGLGAALALLGACSTLHPADHAAEPPQAAAPVGPDPAAPRLPPLDTRRFTLEPNQEIVGETQILFTRYENTFPAIGRQYDLGYEELKAANPTVDQWLPGEATPVYLPTQSILPDAPHEGIVVNVAAMRLFYYTAEKSADGGAPVKRVTTYPIGIGAQGWSTPLGEAKVTGKARDPVWYVPASVRKEHAERGDHLPKTVPPGPDNPLGKYALALSLPGYLIHGTNKPAGVGMRSSHGCIRLYPEDIEELFPRVAKGTRVKIVNQPVLAGWRDGTLYLEVHRPLEEQTHDLPAEAEHAIAAALARNPQAGSVQIDGAAVQRILTEQRGIPLPVVKSSRTIEQYLASARIVENVVPVEQTVAAEPAPSTGAGASGSR